MKQTNKLGGEIVHVVSSSYLLLLYIGPKYEGGDDGSSFIIHGKIALFITEERGVYSSVRRRAMYIDDRRVANAKVRV